MSLFEICERNNSFNFILNDISIVICPGDDDKGKRKVLYHSICLSSKKKNKNAAHF